jgi:cyclin-dependent kinase 10
MSIKRSIVAAEERRANNGVREFKDFEILRKLGEGSFGTAYKVRDIKSGDILVMKQIPISDSDPGDLNNKLQECNVMKNIRHPYICRFK